MVPRVLVAGTELPVAGAATCSPLGVEGIASCCIEDTCYDGFPGTDAHENRVLSLTTGKGTPHAKDTINLLIRDQKLDAIFLLPLPFCIQTCWLPL